MKKLLLSVVAASLAIASIPSQAADSAPALDPKKCVFSYPRAALVNEEQGTTVVKVTVDAAGEVVSSNVATSSGSKALDRATVSVINTCKFAPATKNGKATEATTTVQYIWSLEK